MAITGAHALLYSSAPDELRAVLRDVFGWTHVDADGAGWLIFKLPPAEMAVHPSDGSATHEVCFMCDDITKTADELRNATGVEVRGEPKDQGWGITLMLSLPGGVEVMLYEPRHPVATDL